MKTVEEYMILYIRHPTKELVFATHRLALLLSNSIMGRIPTETAPKCLSPNPLDTIYINSHFSVC